MSSSYIPKQLREQVSVDARNRCGYYKGAQVEAVDPQTGAIVPLFNPHQQPWSVHFRWSEDGSEVIGVTATGRATVVALDLNQLFMQIARRRWAMVGWHPPVD